MLGGKNHFRRPLGRDQRMLWALVLTFGSLAATAVSVAFALSHR